MNKCWKIENLSAAESEVIFYGPIVSNRPIWDKEKRQIQMICPDEFIADMAKLSGKSKLIFRVNSPGGDVFAALAIANYIKGMKMQKVGRVDGMVASAATVLMAAMDTVESPANALWLYHNPKMTLWDTMSVEDMEVCMQDLKTFKESMLDSYMAKATVSREEMSALMDEDKWMLGRDVKAMGLVDTILFENVKVSATAGDSNVFFINGVECDFSAFKNKPKIENVTIREETDEMKIENVSQMEAEYPILVAEVRQAAVAEERKRMQEIEAVSETMPPEMVVEAKYTKPTTAKDLLYNAAIAHKVLGQAYIAAAQADAVASGAEGVEGAKGQPPAGGEKKPKVSMFAGLAQQIDRTVNKEEK